MKYNPKKCVFSCIQFLFFSVYYYQRTVPDLTLRSQSLKRVIGSSCVKVLQLFLKIVKYLVRLISYQVIVNVPLHMLLQKGKICLVTQPSECHLGNQIRLVK